MTTPIVAKKDIVKLQRAIVDGLEDIKAQDIQVFDTEHLSALFERVIVASGTSNRQTKGLAASVRDAVRDAGFPKPRVEGETNGEWIIVDCGQAVVHIMQPSFRQYYNLEELWGEKPVRLKLGSAKPAVAESAKPAKPAPKVETSLRRSNAAKKGVQEAFPSKAQLKKTEAVKAAVAKKAAVKATAVKSVPRKTIAAVPSTQTKELPSKMTAAKTLIQAVKKVVVGAVAKTVAKAAAKKTAAKVPATKKPAAKKSAARQV
jgi:ribosome-associated protein